MPEFWQKQPFNEAHIKIRPCLWLKAGSQVGIHPTRRCVILARFLEESNNPVRGSENRPCAENPSGYRTTLITIRERNLTSTFKNLFLSKVPGTNNPFKIALEALGFCIQWWLSMKLPLNTKTIPTDCHAWVLCKFVHYRIMWQSSPNNLYTANYTHRNLTKYK